MLTAVKPRLLVLNKADTVTASHKDLLTGCLQENMGDQRIIYTNCKNQGDKGVAEVVPAVLQLIKSSERYNREQSLGEFTIMIIGIPNVGKSSLINALRNLHLNKGKATRVGAIPGVTRSVLERIKICESPSVYLLDTPGIMQPNITDAESAFKLALCAAVETHIIGITRVADYLLYWLNKMQNFSYVDLFTLKEPTDDITELLLHLAIKYEKYQTIRTPEGSRTRYPNFEATGMLFVRYFREGKFGKVMLDDDLIDRENVH